MKVITQGYDPFSSVTHKNDQKISKDHYPATKKRVTLTYNGNIMGESWEGEWDITNNNIAEYWHGRFKAAGADKPISQ